jgi:hypothetical protein
MSLTRWHAFDWRISILPTTGPLPCVMKHHQRQQSLSKVGGNVRLLGWRSPGASHLFIGVTLATTWGVASTDLYLRLDPERRDSKHRGLPAATRTDHHSIAQMP